MNLDIIFRIAGIGILVTLLNQLLTRWGRDDIAMVTTVAGLIAVLMMALELVGTFFTAIKSAFSFF